MSDLGHDIEEEDEVRRLISKSESRLETPPFTALLLRRRRSFLGPTTAVAAAALVLVAVLMTPALLRSSETGSPDSSQPVATAVPSVATVGERRPSVAACEEVATPAYVPFRSAAARTGGRSASSQDIVTLTLGDLIVNGEPSELVVTGQAAPPQGADLGEARQVGARMVRLALPQAGAMPAPSGYTPGIPVRSAAVAFWSDPSSACPYFTATLLSSGMNVQALESELLKIVASMPLSAATASPTVPLVGSEAEVWSRIRAAFPTGPIAQPTWLPVEVDRARTELRTLRVSPTREYEVVYRDATGASILSFRLGPLDSVHESGMAFCCIRGTRATLYFASQLFSDPTRPGLRQMRWEEQGRTLSFTSERIKGQDMLRIGWSLDRTTAPPNPYLTVSAKPGACASSAAPEETVARLLSLAGSKDRDALLDCYSLDAINAGGLEVASWADLPPVVDVTLRRHADLAGRVLVVATWTFTSEPGGAWGATNTRFFLLGLEGALWQIYEVSTAPFSTPP